MIKTLLKLSLPLLACLAATAQDTTTNSYTQTDLVSDVTGMAKTLDRHLKNPWGMSKTGTGPWWVSDQVTGLSTVYDANGTTVGIVVTIPTASGTGVGSPTGTAYFGSFVFVTLDGTISEWTGGSNAAIKVNNNSKGAVYTGCTVALNGSANALYVANATGGVEAYDQTFKPITLTPGAFQDANIPAGYKPYGIQTVGSTIYVTFTNGVGVGKGYVDAFDANGKLLLSMKHGKWMDEPFGIAMAPATFGKFANALLVGMTGNGKIAAFNPATGAYLGSLNHAGKPIVNPGLWALEFGAGGNSGPATTLYFTAGIGKMAHGLFGSIKAK